ncbi:MAG: hypothetical protein ACP5QT_02595 [Brevinematia bacterium]
MSDFPSPEKYRQGISKSHLAGLNSYGIKTTYPFVIKREKNQYLYDIDGNKYVDFFLNNGSVIAGHNQKNLTLYIKDAISLSTESVFINKFYYKLVRYFKSIIDIKHIQLYPSQFEAMFELLKFLRPSSIAVNSHFLFNFLKEFFPGIEIDYVFTTKKKNFDLFIFEPLNFDKNLEIFDFKEIMAKKYCLFESRTAFRTRYGFFEDLESVDFVFCGNIISNGMDSCVIISRESIPQKIIPGFLALNILETLKYYRRKEVYSKFLSAKSELISSQKGGILKLTKEVEADELLRYGIFLKGSTLFLSILHTENDIKRLINALKIRGL